MNLERSSPVKAPTLKKGQACTCCRRRKTRCDGNRPICGQCSSNGRELDCEYSDGFAPTRTELLQEYLARLQSRVQTLEMTHAQRSLGDNRQRPSLAIQPSASWWMIEFPPSQVARFLYALLRIFRESAKLSSSVSRFEVFMQHEHQVGWGLNKERFSTAISGGPSSPSFPHPALVNAIFLWGAHFARSPTFSGEEIEQTLLSRASSQAQSQQIATQSLQYGLQAVQAEILLATYLFSMGGRTLETDYHVSASVRLALGFGMNRITPRPSIDPIEEGERISVFWKVFCLDRFWAITNGKPAALRIDGSSPVIVTTPWPKSPEEYAQGNISHSSTISQPLVQFLEEQGNATSGFSYPALAVKAALLCERSSHYASRPTSDDEIRLADSTIFYFVSTLAPLDGQASVARKARFITVHAVAYLAFIRLHEVNAPQDRGAYLRCVQAARYISMLPGHLAQDEIIELEPFCMPSFVIASKVLMQEITRTRQLASSAQAGDVTPPNVLIDELDRLMHCMAEVVPVYPVIESQLESLSDMRTSMLI
ncbi:hypothetical protein ACEPAH_4251 [Sanghuangporus vaninii]